MWQAGTCIDSHDSLGLSYSRLRASLRAEEDARPIYERELRLAEVRLLLVQGAKFDPGRKETVVSFMRAFHSGATIGQREETVTDLGAVSRLIAFR